VTNREKVIAPQKCELSAKGRYGKPIHVDVGGDGVRQRFRIIEGEGKRWGLLIRRRIIVTVNYKFRKRCLNDM